MSISLLFDNTLYTDSLGLDCNAYPHHYSEMRKLYISKNGDVAFTVIGDMLAGDTEAFIVEVMKKIHDDSNTRNDPIDILKNRSVFVMTDKDTYRINQGIMCCIQNIQGTTSVSGDNAMPVLTALHLGLEPQDAIRVSHKVIYGNPPKFPIASIRQTTLLPLNLDYYLATEKNDEDQ